MNDPCTCVRCTTPAYGVPGFDHCAACCYGSLIAEYDLDCPSGEHRELATYQWGLARRVDAFTGDTK